MALFTKVGSILKQNVLQSSASSMMNSVRYMSNKLFVGGLSYGTDNNTLKEAFANFGEVADARVIMDRETGRSRGFGFVEFTDSESANSALSSMDGQDLHGRNIRVSLANERTPGPRTGGNFGGGGYGNQSSGYGNQSSGYGNQRNSGYGGEEF